MDKYSIGEIYQFAVRIEENGEKAYRYFAKKFEKDAKLKELFLFLADEEISHKNTFETMLNKFEDYSSKDNYPEEYFLYIRAFADTVLFSKDEIKKEEINTPKEAFEYAIKKEIDSVNYYNSLKTIVDAIHHDRIDDIIKQEQKHILRLFQFKETIGI